MNDSHETPEASPAVSGSDALGVRAFFELTGRFGAREWEDARSRYFIDPFMGLPRSDCTIDLDACPLCGHNEKRQLFVKDGWPHWRCQGCASIYVSPCLRQDTLDREVYGDSPYPFAEVVNSETQVAFDMPRFQRALERLDQLAPERSVLDIGCGGGLFLDIARRSGWTIAGTEPLAAHRAFAVRRLGTDVVRDKTAAALGMGNRRFGAVTFWEVLDHVTDPMAVLEAGRRWLVPGGIILIYVRSAESLAVRVLRERCNVFLGYAHLSLWSAAAFRAVVDRMGMTLLELRSLVSELGPISNYLAFQDPYRGAGTPVLPGITAEIIEGSLLGYKLLGIMRC